MKIPIFQVCLYFQPSQLLPDIARDEKRKTFNMKISFDFVHTCYNRRCILQVLPVVVFFSTIISMLYHLGTVAFGSLIVTIIQIVRALLKYLERKVRGVGGVRLLVYPCFINIIFILMFCFCSIFFFVYFCCFFFFSFIIYTFFRSLYPLAYRIQY